MEEELDCMRNVDASSIIGYLKKCADSGYPALSFLPIVDNRTQLADYTAPAKAKTFSRVPTIIGTTKNEGVAFLSYNRTHGVNTTEADEMTNTFFLYPAVKITQERYAANATTCRYLYGGNFSNIAPQPWESAYHSSDLPLILDTYGIARGKGSKFQKELSEKIQDFWVAFAEDPVHGLPKLGWNACQPGGEAVLLAVGDSTVQGIEESELWAPCNLRGPRRSLL